MPTELREVAPATPGTPQPSAPKPPGAGQQGLVLVAAFLGGPALGWIVGQVPAGLSEGARTFLCAPFVVVFFLGYAAWVARLKVIAFQGLGLPLLRALYHLVVRREKPRSVEDVLPSREQLLDLARKARGAGAAFRRVGWVVGIAAGFVAAFFESSTGPATRFVLVSATTVGWGYALALLARQGWLPIPEQA